MLIWSFVGILAVSVVKYYTAAETRRLNRRLMKARGDRDRVKQELQEVKKEQASQGTEEELYELRIRSMKELIQDLGLRLTVREDASRGVALEENLIGVDL